MAPVIALVVVLPLAGMSAATAQTDPPLPLPDPVVIPYHVTGPPAERLNLVILGDGYQWDQQSLFFEDVDRNFAVMRATEPYKSYLNYINIYLVSIASIHYGVRCDPDGRVRHPDGTIRDTGEREGPIDEKNTALRMIFQDGCSNPLARGVVYGPAPVNCQAYVQYYSNPANACETGSQAHDRIMTQHVAPHLGSVPVTSQNVQTLAIFNTFTYGGIGGTSATTSGGSPQGPLISLHELGHSHGTMADEYPYSSRDVVRPCYTGAEPGSFHHTIRTSTQDMIDTQHKWWRWIGEESLSGGVIGLHEGGNTFPCGVRRPSQHSIMRWLGFDWDQVGREHMVARITGLRNTGAMPLPSRAEAGLVGPDEVLWVRPIQPRDHGMQITWRLGGAAGSVVETNNSPFLDLGALNPPPSVGTLVHVEVRDPVGPGGTDWVRNPSTGSSATDSGYNGPRFVQTRQWTVGLIPVTPSPVQAEMITGGTLTENPVNGTEWVYVQTAQPMDRVLKVTWDLDGVEIPNPHNLRALDLGALGLPRGTYTLRAIVTDPADPGVSDTRQWVVDYVLPTAPRTLTEPLTTLEGGLEHPVYFGGWDMWLYPEDDLSGYDQERYVVGQLRLNEDGWFNYFGFPEEPMPDTPFKFRHSGTSVKALTYGNLGTGGLSKATFEQYFDGHPSGTFEPGYGTHFIEHRAIDPAGNIGEAEAYRATVLPGESPECTVTLRSTSRPRRATSQGTEVLVVRDGVTCVAPGATLIGGVVVRPGASLVLRDGARIIGDLRAEGARVIQLFGARVAGDTVISGTTEDVILAGSSVDGSVSLADNQGRVVTIFSGATREYGILAIGNRIGGDLSCSGNTPFVNELDVPNTVGGQKLGQCVDV
jgi:hypothetical protein